MHKEHSAAALLQQQKKQAKADIRQAKIFIAVTMVQHCEYVAPYVNSLPHISQGLQGLPNKFLSRSESGDLDAEGRLCSIARGGLYQELTIHTGPLEWQYFPSELGQVGSLI